MSNNNNSRNTGIKAVYARAKKIKEEHKAHKEKIRLEELERDKKKYLDKNQGT